MVYDKINDKNTKKVLKSDLKLVDKLIAISHEMRDYDRICEWNVLKCDLIYQAY